MTNTNTSSFASAPREIDVANLDQVVGAGVAVPEARKQERDEKLVAEELKK